MTNEEMLSVLKNQLQYARFTGTSSTMIPNDVAELAIDGIEKQIPKKPTMWGDGYADGNPVIESYECPNCGAEYDLDYDGELDYCHKCGQKLDW